MMFDPRSGFRPVLILTPQGIGKTLVWLLILALTAYILVGMLAIYVTVFALLLSPILIFIPLGFALGRGFANRPLRCRQARYHTRHPQRDRLDPQRRWKIRTRRKCVLDLASPFPKSFR